MKYGEHVISSKEALSLEELPKRIAVVGGGYIGLELGITFRMLERGHDCGSHGFRSSNL